MANSTSSVKTTVATKKDKKTNRLAQLKSAALGQQPTAPETNGVYTNGTQAPLAASPAQEQATPAVQQPAAEQPATNGYVKKEKTPCPVSVQEFVNTAKPMNIVLDGMPNVADAKVFSTGSLGWGFNGKITVTINGKKCSAQVGLNVTLVGSKELAR